MSYVVGLFGLNMNEASAIDIKLGLSKEDFLDIILLERRKEFAFEGQRRFFFLIGTYA